MYPTWQRKFRAFAGPGIDHPSDSMRVTDGEAAALLADLAGQAWSPAAFRGEGLHAGYTVRHALAGSTAAPCATALFAGDAIVGLYAGSYLWIARDHRGRGLSAPLILEAAARRGGTVVPPGVAFQGYTRAGLAAHRSAHHHAVLTALAAGLPVPPEVVAEVRGPCRSAAATPALPSKEAELPLPQPRTCS